MRLISPKGPKVTRKSERKAKRKKRKKTEHSYVFILSTLKIAGHDGQQRVYPRAKVISIVFINPGGYTLILYLVYIVTFFLYTREQPTSVVHPLIFFFWIVQCSK